MTREIGRYLVILGVALVVTGLLFTVGSRLGLGRLPGDISITRGNFRLIIPLGTCLLLSLVLTLLLRFLGNR